VHASANEKHYDALKAGLKQDWRARTHIHTRTYVHLLGVVCIFTVLFLGVPCLHPFGLTVFSWHMPVESTDYGAKEPMRYLSHVWFVMYEPFAFYTPSCYGSEDASSLVT
jgi:hypothetical protein